MCLPDGLVSRERHDSRRSGVLVRGEHSEQLPKCLMLRFVDDRVVEHDADRLGGTDDSGEGFSPLVRAEPHAAAMRVPVETNGYLGESGLVERDCADVARQHSKIEIDQAPGGLRGAPVPRWRENWPYHRSEQVLQALPPALDVAPLIETGSGMAEFTFAAFVLVVDVREPVLVDGDAIARIAHGSLESPRERQTELRRNHRQIDRQAVAGEEIEQREEPVVAPADIVVAEEERHRSARRVERPEKGIQPGAGRWRHHDRPSLRLWIAR